MNVLASDLPRWAVMWLLAGALFGIFKLLTWRAAAAAGDGRLRWRSAAYLLGWVGLDPGPFVSPRRPGERPATGEWAAAWLEATAGAGLLWLALPRLGDLPRWLVAWIGLVGIGLLLHFGLFQLLALFWRRAGIAVQPIMKNPLAACSLSDFWSRRWNRAFRDLTHRHVFRPVRRRHGATAGLLAVFLSSGLLHELVISLPAGGGWGLPTLYFAIQAGGLLLERSWRGGRSSGGPSDGLSRRLFALAVVLLPAPALFHPPFISRVVLPFLDAIGAL